MPTIVRFLLACAGCIGFGVLIYFVLKFLGVL
ncbi:hypothetical protein HG1285_08356 [Hydrogenivirga sp. 128-5-R1-1]|nr:hypothetical protein HG1285_08356 [Hydrogenivirga sp. 128-5-R1-1]